MSAPRVAVFFYGSFISRSVLAEAGYRPERVEVARLDGFDIRIAPLANVVPSPGGCVYGILTQATHDELARLYSQDWVGTYLPHPVVVETQQGDARPALCYIAPSMTPQQPANDYIDRIVRPAREYGFPEWYIERLERFRP
jgi:hypothetical protein